MGEVAQSARLFRFGTFEVDLRAGELRKNGVKLKLTGQPLQVLEILLQNSGEVVTREELQSTLWPNTFVEVEHNLNSAINRIREVLGDSAESPRFVETLPRRGYRFIAPVSRTPELGFVKGSQPGNQGESPSPAPPRFPVVLRYAGTVFLLVLIPVVMWMAKKPQLAVQRSLTRVTFDDGLQIGASWSPDGRFLAYSSDRGGKFDIWVQQVSGGDPVQITKGPGPHWQPDWSPDGKFIVYRSEEGEGGLFVVPALGGDGLERKVSTFGFYPRWSPDSSRILFQTTYLATFNRFYVVGIDGSPAREFLPSGMPQDLSSSDSAAWHPDGERISIWRWTQTNAPDIWTAPVSGGAAVELEIDPGVEDRFKEVAQEVEQGSEWSGDFKFSWAPSGRAIYFERTFRGARNVWRLDVDSQSRKATGTERLTTGVGGDSELSVSGDGKRLAFTGESSHTRVWMFPFDAIHGRITGVGRAVTSASVEGWAPNVSHDGRNLVFGGRRAGKWNLWVKSLPEGPEIPVVADDSWGRYQAQWSNDGKSLAYERVKLSTRERQIVVWSNESRAERPITALTSTPGRSIVFGWSPDGKALLTSQWTADPYHAEIWEVPVPMGMRAQNEGKKIIADPAYALYQSRFSPNGRWIAFGAVRNKPDGMDSRLFVIPAGGGSWVPVTDGKNWDDKPYWAPDGKTIYYLSSRGGIFNVWGIHFDPTRGQTVGNSFSVTSFERPSQMIPRDFQDVELSLTQDYLAICVAEVSGSIWVLDHVEK